jgi:DNA-directed RNA polymerase specialized sigma24 family protein
MGTAVCQSKTEHKQDAFPVTVRTWIGRRLDDGDEAAVREHIMDVYADPLRIYLLGSSLRWLGEPSDLVAGFFADRLSRPAFLSRWRNSRRPLRFWLIVGFKHYLYEEARRQKRGGQEQADPALEVPALDRAYEQNCAIGIVRRALTIAEESCDSAHLSAHWEVFELFHLKEMSLQQIADAKGLSPSRVTVMKRTAAKHFQRCVRDMVSWDGATDPEVDAEVCSLMEGLA